MNINITVFVVVFTQQNTIDMSYYESRPLYTFILLSGVFGAKYKFQLNIQKHSSNLGITG